MIDTLNTTKFNSLYHEIQNVIIYGYINVVKWPRNPISDSPDIFI